MDQKDVFVALGIELSGDAEYGSFEVSFWVEYVFVFLLVTLNYLFLSHFIIDVEYFLGEKGVIRL